jgi:hypothetical protein
LNTINYFCAFIAFIAISGCTNKEDTRLTHRYKIWAMSPNEIYLSDHNDLLIFGPGLKKVAVGEKEIVACCEEIKDGKTVIYGIIQTDGGEVLRLNEYEFHLKTRKLDLVWQPVSDFY